MNYSEFLYLIKELRYKHNYNQAYVADKLNLSTRQYQRIENNNSYISLDALSKLSKLYSFNLLNIYLKLEDVKFQDYINLKNLLIKIFENKEYKNLNLIIDNIKMDPLKYFDSQHGLKVEQLFLFANAIKLKIDNQNNKSFKTLMQSIKILNPKFKICNITSYIYTDIEFLIILSILNYKYIQEEYDINIEKILLTFLNNKYLGNKYLLFVKFNILYFYINNKENEKILEIFKIIESFINENSLQHYIYLYYYLVGLYHFNNNNAEYSIYFNKALNILKLLKFNDLHYYYKIKIQTLKSKKCKQTKDFNSKIVH